MRGGTLAEKENRDTCRERVGACLAGGAESRVGFWSVGEEADRVGPWEKDGIVIEESHCTADDTQVRGGAATPSPVLAPQLQAAALNFSLSPLSTTLMRLLLVTIYTGCYVLGKIPRKR